MKFKIIHSDITTIESDVIVNPAHYTLLGGGGCDGMIHKVAGVELLEECKKLGGCRKGKAKITKGYNLPAKYIIHTVGPMFGQENGREEKILESCYVSCFELAKEYNLKIIAFPCIGTGCYHFPKDKAAEIAINVAKKYLEHFNEIIFVCYLELDYNVYLKLQSDGTDSNEITVNSL